MNRCDSGTDSIVWMEKDSARMILPCYPPWMVRFFVVKRTVHVLTDEEYMKIALDLAEKARGMTSPNPLVGCVIVNQEGKIIGEGYHHKAGQPHAEIMAMRDAGENNVRGCTAYVTLEPCSHYGRTGPCCEALIKAGIKKVVAAADDPNPKVSGRGFSRLRAAGVEVVQHVLEKESLRQNEVFMHWMTTGRPFVALKYAMTLDGKIATASGDSKWISNKASRTYAHTLRSQYDAVLVGKNTVLTDDPALTVRMVKGKNPLRIVLDTHCQLPMDRQVFQDHAAETLFVTGTEADKKKIAAFQKLEKVRVLQVPEQDSSLDLGALLATLGKQEITSLLVEGGSKVHGAFFDKRLVQRVYAFVAPVLLGGEKNVSPIGGEGASTMEKRVHLKDVSCRNFGTDVMVTGILEGA